MASNTETQPDDYLRSVENAEWFVIAARGAIAFRYGPYTGPEAGAIMQQCQLEGIPVMLGGTFGREFDWNLARDFIRGNPAEWHSMDGAPRDGTEIIVDANGCQTRAVWWWSWEWWREIGDDGQPGRPVDPIRWRHRHMEADGVPYGYDRWRKVGAVRNPVDRLWSLYKYLDRFGLDWCQEHDETYTARMRASVQVPFEQWLLNNDLPFTTPYDSAGLGRFFPAYACRHALPENRKSQFMYLRPDLGTHVYRFDSIEMLHATLDVEPPRINGTEPTPPPKLTAEGQEYVDRWFAWDIDAAGPSA